MSFIESSPRGKRSAAFAVVGLGLALVMAAWPPAVEAGGPPRQGQTQQQPAPAQGQQPAGPATTQQEPLSQREEAAMELIRRILEEEEGVLMGRDFSYDPSGRRDPFRSLLAQPTTESAPSVRPAGLPGFLINEVELKAIAAFQGRWTVMMTGPDQKAYFAEVGSELFDGHVKEIREGEVIFEQRVADVLGVRRTREVIKRLRETGGGSESQP